MTQNNANLRLRASVLEINAQKFGEHEGAVILVAGQVDLPGRNPRSFYERVKAFGKTARFALTAVKAGDVVDIAGKLAQRTSDGKSYVDPVALRIDVLDASDFEFISDAKDQQVLAHAINEVIAVGNLTKDPTEFGDENKGARDTVAVDEKYTRGDQDVEYTHFLDFVGWAGVAETLMGLSKGQRVTVIGPVFTNRYQTKDDETRFRTEIHALTVAKHVDRRDKKADAKSDGKKTTAAKGSNKTSTGKASSKGSSKGSPKAAKPTADDEVSEADLPF